MGQGDEPATPIIIPAMRVLAIILARAGSKGLPDKCVRSLRGQALVTFTFDHALSSTSVDKVVFSTDSTPAAALARASGIRVIDRPADLATDTASVDAVARHAVEILEGEGSQSPHAIVLLYGNIPVRAAGVIDRAVRHLLDTGADSVRTVAPLTKHHPDWTHRLEGDRLVQYRTNSVYRRQDLEPLYYHDGAVAVVTRDALFSPAALAGDRQAFWGEDRRAIVQKPNDSVDVDEEIDLHIAEAILGARRDVKPPRLRIGQTEVGAGRPVFLIAEAGVNHGGDVDEALRMVDAAVGAGANAVKFQMFTAADLTTGSVPAAPYQSKRLADTTQRDMLAKLQLTTADFARIARRCDDSGIVFLATPFSVTDVDRLVSMGAVAIKIASPDLVDIGLLERACASGLPLIVSTGAADEEEIAAAVTRIVRSGARCRLALLHCVSVYPTAMADANLRAMDTLAQRFGTVVGYSDHTTSTSIGAMAVGAGARILEKHFTLNRAAEGPDHAMSLDPPMLAEYIQSVREAEAAMGSGSLDVNEAEQEVRRVARKSLVAVRTIAPGETIRRDMLTSKRAGGGIPPTEIYRLLGRKAVKLVEADTPLSWSVVS